MPIFHAETIIFENRHEKIALTVMYNEKEGLKTPKARKFAF